MMCNRILFMFAFVFAFAFVGIFADEPEKLVNGIPTTIEENPHVVSIRINNTYICGGNIIGPRHILTAGNCLTSLERNPEELKYLNIVSGTTYLNKDGDVHKMERMYIHEYYYEGRLERTPGYDIGLIKLANPIEFNQRQQPIGLPSSNITENEPVTLVSWGATRYRGPMHNDLRKLNAQSMLHDECQFRHILVMKIHPNEFCSLIARGTGACQGDSGSGVIRNGDKTIAGLVSGGYRCAEGFPDVYTTVFPYVSWINGKMAL